MPRTLPFRTISDMGEVLDIAFTLHRETGSPAHVARLLSSVLSDLDRELAAMGAAANGDVLQALAMALALRAEMIRSPRNVTHALARGLLNDALTSIAHTVEDGAGRRHHG